MLHSMFRPIPFAERDEEIHVTVGRLVELAARDDLQAQIRVFRWKRGNMIAQPHGSESSGTRDAKNPFYGFAAALLMRLGKQREGPLDVVRVALSARRQCDSLAAAAPPP